MKNNLRKSIQTIPILVILLWIVIGTCSAQTTNNRIAFMSDRDGNREIYTMNPDGSDVRRLTNNDAQDLQPAWSPDKSRIAFVSNRDGNFAVYVMNADGSNQRRISADEFAYHEYPVWSPDDHYLAYASDKAGSFDIYTVEANGNNPQRLTSGDTYETEPAWSPDGRQIAYLQQVDGVFEVFLTSTSGGNPQRLTQSAGGDYFSPRWSPDGSKLAYALTIFDRAGNSSEIYVRDMATGEENLLVSRENSFVQGLSWSEDGTRLVYQVQEIQAKWIIHSVNTRDATLLVLTDQSYNSETPSWFTPHLADATTRLISGLSSNQYNIITYARINTRYGATLNLRQSTSTSATILEELPFGSIVSIISESVNHEGYRWRQVVSPTGITGWCVESADNVTTLIFADSLIPELIVGQEKMSTGPRYRYQEPIYGLMNGEIWTRPDSDYGRVIERLWTSIEMEISGIVFAGNLADGSNVWWYLVRVPGELEARGWMPEIYISSRSG